MLTTQFKALLSTAALLTTSVTLGACGTEFTYDTNSLFPEDYQSSYSKQAKFDCTESATHGGDYVRVWLSPEIKPAYESDAEAPEGAVALKEQFSDSSCEELTSITAFKKDASSSNGWKWQNVQSDGSVEFTVDENYCSSCHTADRPDCTGVLCAK